MKQYLTVFITSFVVSAVITALFLLATGCTTAAGSKKPVNPPMEDILFSGGGEG